MFDPAGRTCTLADERFVLGSGEPICGVIFASQTQENVAKRRNSPTSRLCKEAARSLDGPGIVTPGCHSNAGCTFYRQAKFSGFAFAQSCSQRAWKNLDILPFDASQKAGCMLPDEQIALVCHRPLPSKAVSRFESPKRAEPSGAQYTVRAAPSVPRGQIHAERIHTT